MRRFVLALVYWGPALAWAGLIAYLSHVPSLQTGAPGVWDLIVRKIGHIGEYAVLTFLVWRALRAHRISRGRALIYSGALALVFAASDEVHQSFIPGREGALRDVAIDAVGIGAWLLLSRWEANIPRRFVAVRDEDD